MLMIFDYIYIAHIDFENTNIVQWHGYVML